MQAFKTNLIASVGAFLGGVAAAATGLALNMKVASSNSGFKSAKERVSRIEFPLARVARAPSDPDTPAGYSPLGIANISGRRIAVYVFHNGAKADDVAGRGQGFADVFDHTGRLMKRFAFRENLNSPPQITEYIFIPAR
jgi:hypothetical protein